jgi:hypothetical protein
VGGYAGMLAVLKLHAACYRRQIISQAIGSAPDPMAARHYPRGLGGASHFHFARPGGMAPPGGCPRALN